MAKKIKRWCPTHGLQVFEYGGFTDAIQCRAWRFGLCGKKVVREGVPSIDMRIPKHEWNQSTGTGDLDSYVIVNHETCGKPLCPTKDSAEKLAKQEGWQLSENFKKTKDEKFED